MNQQDQWLTAKEVADMFRVSPPAVRRWVRLGKLDARTFAGRLCFDRAVVMAFLAGESR